MELRVLQYFLAVAREESITGAAEFLHLTQPTLSRQLKELEEELGKQLFVRGSRKITLTEEGVLLRKRAEEIVDLVHKTENELTLPNEVVAGDVYIGAGETDAVRLLARAAREVQRKHPQVRYHIASGDARDVIENLDKGLIDFGILIDPVDISKYNFLKFPVKDVWGVLMRKDSPLAVKDRITPEDLCGKPVMVSRQALKNGGLTRWLGCDAEKLNIVATYNLVFNASLLVDEGLGYALTLDKLINTTGQSALCFKPLEPKLEVGLSIVWKKYQVLSKAAEAFLDKMRQCAGGR